MSNTCFKGSVKAQAYKVKMALHNHEVAYNLAKAAQCLAIDKSKVEKRFYKRLFWEVQLTVEKAILKGYHGSSYWFSYNWALSNAYPDIYTEDFRLIIYDGLDNRKNIKHLLQHNPSEFYLNVDQAAWVNKWAEKTTEVH